MHAEKLDQTDILILEMLQKDARIRLNELAEKVKLSVPSVSDRLRKLEESGVIRSYNAVLEASKVGLELMAFIFVSSDSSTHYQQIIKRATAHPEILECHAVTGEGSHIIKARTRNTASLERLLSQIQSWPGVTNTRTSVVLSSPKETTVLPLEQPE